MLVNVLAYSVQCLTFTSLSQSQNEPSELDTVIIPFREGRTLSQRSETRQKMEDRKMDLRFASLKICYLNRWMVSKMFRLAALSLKFFSMNICIYVCLYIYYPNVNISVKKHLQKEKLWRIIEKVNDRGANVFSLLLKRRAWISPEVPHLYHGHHSPNSWSSMVSTKSLKGKKLLLRIYWKTSWLPSWREGGSFCINYWCDP